MLHYLTDVYKQDRKVKFYVYKDDELDEHENAEYIENHLTYAM